MHKHFRIGRNNLAATIFVPYDCANNCPFCTSKKDYADTSKFSLSKIKLAINLIGQIKGVKDFVITGGEPFADLRQLHTLLETCKVYNKNVFINTTLPAKDQKEADEIFNFIKAHSMIISGINVSRHIALKSQYENDELVAKVNTIVPVKINSVLYSLKKEFDIVTLTDFIKKYTNLGLKNICFRADYTKITNMNELKGLDDPFVQKLSSMDNLSYVSSGGCLVCNDDTFAVKDTKGAMVHYHRGTEHSAVELGDTLIVNDIVIKQDGSSHLDWSDNSDNSDFKHESQFTNSISSKDAPYGLIICISSPLYISNSSAPNAE